MAKSLRSKAKRTFRRDKREKEQTDYAVTDAARLARLSGKLRAKFEPTPMDEDSNEDESLRIIAEGGTDAAGPSSSSTDVPAPTSSTEGETASLADGPTPAEAASIQASTPKISTSGRRPSRRAEWRLSKGMSAKPRTRHTLNKQGQVPAKRKAGRSHRRR